MLTACISDNVGQLRPFSIISQVNSRIFKDYLTSKIHNDLLITHLRFNLLVKRIAYQV